MLLLALDTATSHATVAVCDDDDVLAEGHREVTTHSEGLLSLIDQTLAQSGHPFSQIDAVICGRGPGSFTGLRIGLATAKGLCFASGKPLLCLSSLLPIAQLTAEQINPGDRPIVAILDARRQEVFCGLYRQQTLLQAEFVCKPEALAQRLPPALDLILAGDGALRYQEVILGALGNRATLAPDGCHHLFARYLAAAARDRVNLRDFEDLEEAVPLYIRASDAKLPTISLKTP